MYVKLVCSFSVHYFSLSSLTFYSVEDILQVLIVFIVESLELNFALLFPERHTLLRVLPVLVVLAASSEKDSESLYKRVKINRLMNIFKVCSFVLVQILNWTFECSNLFFHVLFLIMI